MPLNLWVFYILSLILSYTIALAGLDALYPKNEQILFLLFGSFWNLHTSTGFVLASGGAGLTLVILSGFITDLKTMRKNKKV